MAAPASHAAKSNTSRISSLFFNKRWLQRFQASRKVFASRLFIASLYPRRLSSVNRQSRIAAFFSVF
jgi:hypothetical protein